MFVILLTYKKPLEIVDQHLADHAVFLDKCYQSNYFVVSGRRNPRTGGVIISQLTSRTELEKILKEDPFYRHDIADYEVIEFTPAKCHGKFNSFIDQSI